MPWINRPGRQRPGGRLRQNLRRWRYDHSQGLTSFWIGAVVVVVAVVVMAVLRVVS